ncbi:MAG: helix-hairpin-helix domain-containing protein [Planctomycetes bacterium]|nr:helix-hairpin-helix domain-containing protein [Planctomycetota bacterium]
MSNLPDTDADSKSDREPPPAITLPPATPEPSAPLEIAAKSADAYLWLRRGDQVFVGLLIALLLGLLGIHWVRLSRWGTAPVELSSQKPREYYYSLDINTASWVEWSQLDGIGETLARRIVADREERGLFHDPEEVNRVRGIGPKLMDRIRPFLRGGTDAVATEERVTE